MKTLDRIQQRILGMTKKQLQLVSHPGRFYYFDDPLIYDNKRYIQ